MDGFKYDKSYYISKHNISIHYGDSDDDILAAREVGIRGIRVQRPYNSTNPQKMNGGYGEEVVINSAWQLSTYCDIIKHNTKVKGAFKCQK